MRLLRPALALSALVVAACFGDKAAQVSFGDDSARTIVLGPGDVKVTSTDGVLILAVVGDSVRMQLSDSMRASVKQEIDSSAQDSRLASAILKSVSSVVNNAMGFVVRVHVNDVRNLRYEDGSIRFEVPDGNVNFEKGKNSSSNAQFSEEDARRFIDAVEERQRGAPIAQ